MTKKTTSIIASALLALGLAGCSAADTASWNASRASDNFEVNRRIIFINGITDNHMLTIEGLCSINSDNEDMQLEVTCKIGDGQYKKHYLGVSDNVTYVVEQVDAIDADPYHYRVIVRPEAVIPDLDVETSGS